MTIVVMSQALRQKQAAAYLSTQPDEEKKVVVTRDTSRVDLSILPPGTEVLTWGSGGADALSPGGLAAILVAKAKTFVRSGSPLAAKLGRWFESAEWRLRYVDRLQTLARSRGGSKGGEPPPELVALLEEVVDCGAREIAILDVFDLPAVMRLERRGDVEVRLI